MDPSCAEHETRVVRCGPALHVAALVPPDRLLIGAEVRQHTVERREFRARARATSREVRIDRARVRFGEPAAEHDQLGDRPFEYSGAEKELWMRTEVRRDVGQWERQLLTVNINANLFSVRLSAVLGTEDVEAYCPIVRPRRNARRKRDFPHDAAVFTRTLSISHRLASRARECHLTVGS